MAVTPKVRNLNPTGRQPESSLFTSSVNTSSCQVSQAKSSPVMLQDSISLPHVVFRIIKLPEQPSNKSYITLGSQLDCIFLIAVL
jgi:hypothetical protein